MQDIKSLILVTIFIFLQCQNSLASDTSSLFDSSSVQDMVNNIYDEEFSINSMEKCFIRTKTLSSMLMKKKIHRDEFFFKIDEYIEVPIELKLIR